MYTVDNLQKMERDFMDNEVKEILMQLVDTTNKLAEGQKQTNERLDKMDERFDKIDNRLDEQYNMIYQLTLNGEKMQKDISTLQADVKSIKIELENRISPSIKTLCEVQLDTSNRVHNLEHNMQELNDQLVIGEVLHNIKDI